MSLVRLARGVRGVRGLRPALISRYICTSGKRSDTVAAPSATPAATTAATETAPANKNWVSYGFSEKSQTEDENESNAIFFFAISIAIVGGGFVLAYRPSHHNRDWASREAFLELRRREANGLPAIDRNYMDPALIVLPPDEELKDLDIQI